MEETIKELRSHLIRMWRFRWFGMIICWMVAVVGTVNVLLMPDQYSSNARVWIDTETALRPLMRGLAVQGNLGEQVRVIQRTLLSTPNLERVIRMVDLDLDIETDADMQNMVASLGQKIDIRSEGKQIFRVGYESANAILARDIVHAVVTIFIESNLGQNRDDIAQAETFIAAQIEEYESQLKAAEERMATFRTQNIDIISGTKSFAQKIEGTRSSMAALEFELEEANILRNQIQARLEDTPRFLTLESSPQLALGGGGSTAVRIQSLYRELDSLLLKYTESHPDVIATRRRIQTLADRYNEEKDSDTSSVENELTNKSKVPNPLYEQLTLNHVAASSELGRLERRRARGQEQLNRLVSLQSIAPAIEAEMASFNRDYGVIKQKYESLLGSRESARLASAIESDTDAVMFRMVDPPRVAAGPSGPPRVIYLGLVLLVAFGAGGSVALLRSQFDETFVSSDKLEEYFGLPTVGSVTRLQSVGERARSAFDGALFVAAAAVPVVIVGLTILLLPYLTGLRGLVNLSAFGGLV